jgi:hypothetical protein
MKTKIDQLKSLPYGSLVSYKNNLYFKSRGLDKDIVTSAEGMWFFIDELNWKNFSIVYIPE